MHPDVPADAPDHPDTPDHGARSPARVPPEGPAGPQEPVVRRGLVPQPLLDPDAVFVVKRLQRSGHEAYLVGGCVRDLLAGLEPKDFDVATDAHPGRIKRLFHAAHIIGRRFRLVHVRFPGNRIIETSTFRGDPERIQREAEAAGQDLDTFLERHGVENMFGTAPEDARRRDFSINALFYDPVADEVIDWVDGLADLEQHVVRAIGDPDRRLIEDPVRMIRAVHFAQRLDFAIEPVLLAAIERHAARLGESSQARLYVELQKIVSRGKARPTLHKLWELGVLRAWIPELAEFLDRPQHWPSESGGTHEEARRGEPAGLPTAHATWNLLGAADRWGLSARAAPESLTMAVLFGPWLLETWAQGPAAASARPSFFAFQEHLERTFRPVALRMSIPRWVSARLADVLWMLLELREGPQARRSRGLSRRGFAEALALLEMDVRARGATPDLLDAWVAAANEAGADTELAPPHIAREEALDSMPPDRRRRGARRGGRRQRSAGEGPSRPLPLAVEADAWEPPPLPDDEPPAMDPAPAPRSSAPPPPPPRHRAPAPPAAPAAAPPQPPPPPPPPRPRSPLADDDFSAGLA